MNKIIIWLWLALCSSTFSLNALAGDFSGRGIYSFPSSTGCPIGGDVDCDRVALDDDSTRVKLDTAGHRIIFENNRDYDKKTMVGDVVIHGKGVAKDGTVVPLSLHVFIYKKHHRWTVKPHAHAPVSGKFDKLEIDPYELLVSEAAGTKSLLKPGDAAKVIADPSLAARIVKELVELQDNRKQPEDTPDITVAIGLGKLAKSVVRVHFDMDDAHAKNMGQLLTEGSWSISIQPLSSHVPVSTVRRDLFLFGLDQHPLLKDMVDNGFSKKEPLVIGAGNGKGYIRLGAESVDYPDAAAAARAFLQNSFIGEILVYQQQTRPHNGG